jgi:hypothetical protein
MKNKLTELRNHNGQPCSLDLSRVIGIIPQTRGCFLMTSTQPDSGVCVLEDKIDIDLLMKGDES